MSLAWRVRAITATAIIPPLLEVTSFARIERVLTALARWSATRGPEDVLIARWVDRQLTRLPSTWNYTCLRRATIMYFLLRSARREVDLCIGVRRTPEGKLGAHAWLLRNDQLYLESPSATERNTDYTIIARFPSPARAT